MVQMVEHLHRERKEHQLDNKTAAALNFLISNPAEYQGFLDFLETRILEKVQILKSASDIKMIQRAQGAIEELERMKSLRDEVKERQRVFNERK